MTQLTLFGSEKEQKTKEYKIRCFSIWEQVIYEIAKSEAKNAINEGKDVIIGSKDGKLIVGVEQ